MPSKIRSLRSKMSLVALETSVLVRYILSGARSQDLNNSDVSNEYLP